MEIEDIIDFDFYNLVDINYKLLGDFIDFFRNKNEILQRKPNEWKDNKYWLDPLEGQEKNSQYFTIGNSINFKFWEYEGSNLRHVKGIKGGLDCQGSSYMWRCLKVCIDNDEYPILDASFLSKLDIDVVNNIFKTDDNKVVMTCLKDRWLNWKDLGKKLIKKYNGKFYNLILESKNSIENFINLSKEFRAFDDPLNKMTMVNAILHQGREIVDFNGNIFPGIDYHLVTQVLRIGLLVLDGTLEYKIENKNLLDKKESLAIRKATLKCLMSIANKLKISGDIIDNIFFFNGKQNCTHNLTCQDTNNLCIFENICKKKIKYFMPLENTRYY